MAYLGKGMEKLSKNFDKENKKLQVAYLHKKTHIEEKGFECDEILKT